MGRTSKPNWTAIRVRDLTWEVYDLNGSGRAYRVTFSHGGRIHSAYNVTNGNARALDPDGRTAKELAAVARRVMSCG